MTDYSEKEMLEIDFLIDELEKKVVILEQKIGLEAQSQSESAKLPDPNAPTSEPTN
jgi:hypothetical protein